MANIKSSKKRILTAAKKTEQNKNVRTALRTQIKKANFAIENNESSNETIRETVKKIDQAVAKGLLHKNTAARKKSSLARKVNA